MKNRSKYYGVLVATAGLIASLAIALPANAQTIQTGVNANISTNVSGQSGYHGGFGRGMGMTGMHNGVFGTVSAISGTTLTVTSKTWQKPSGAPATGTSGTSATPPATTTTTYTVDASNATVTKGSASSAVSDIAVGDTVMVQGTVSGTSVTATKINDGPVPQGMGGHMGQPGQGGFASSTRPMPASIIQGNGEPVVAGSVTAISGLTLTVTNKSNVTYSIDASSATIEKGNATSSIADVATGDNVIVQGTVNGTSVTASSVIDQGPTPSTTTGGKPSGPRGFFASIGSFFSRIFGF